MQSGIISKTYGSFYTVLSETDPGRELLGSLRGRLRLRKNKEPHSNYRQRHLLSIGDRVSFSFSKRDSETHSITIEDVFARSNSLERFHRHRIHCLGANLSRAVLLVSLASPAPHFGFVDRFLCAAHIGRVEPWIIFTKRDLYEKNGSRRKDFLPFHIYKNLGYSVFWVNLKRQEELKDLKKNIYSGSTLFLGQSGVGKSTLLNQLLGKTIQKIAPVSLRRGHGRHTSSNASLFFHSSSKALLIDTPGLQEWGLGHLKRQGVLEAFSELRPFMQKCQFSDCTHQSSSLNCAVEDFLSSSQRQFSQKERRRQTKATTGIIYPSRLRSLENILASLR